MRPIAARFLIPALATAAALIAAAPWSPETVAATAASRRAPELPRLDATHWLNSPPLTLASLRGRPVLVEFWTFGCSNCRNTLPWLERVHARYAPQGLVIIAVHTPEFDGERDREAVESAVARLGIRYPVLIDNHYAYWRALDNQYWPAFYLIDADGRIVDTRIGELHAGSRRADAFETAIAALVRPGTAEAAARPLAGR
jgi:thiol-disulfide isomerase/thioredoxin